MELKKKKRYHFCFGSFYGSLNFVVLEGSEDTYVQIQVQHRSPVMRGIGVAAAAATGGTATTAVPGGVANQFKPMSLYIGDLNINVTDTQLYQLFNQAGQVISVRICRDFSTRRSLGYGFVNYSNPQDAARAMEMLDFTPVNGKSIRVKRSHRDPNSPKNRTANLFIRNLDKSIEIKALHDTFSSFGHIPSCKIVTDSNGQSKGYGFVQFDNDESAQSAIDKLNGMLINGKQVYVAHALCKEKSGRGTSWGKVNGVVDVLQCAGNSNLWWLPTRLKAMGKDQS